MKLSTRYGAINLVSRWAVVVTGQHVARHITATFQFRSHADRHAAKENEGEQRRGNLPREIRYYVTQITRIG